MRAETEENKQILCAQQGDAHAMEAILARHDPLIRSLASRVLCEYVKRDELLQSGRIGLIRAVKRYSSSQEVRLVTYAVPWILGEMRRCIRQERAHAAEISLQQETKEKGVPLLELLQGGAGVDLTSIDLHMAMEKLENEARLVVCLRYFRDRTQKETAALLRKSQAQISRIERQALDALRMWLS